jgi:hypothetical protein
MLLDNRKLRLPTQIRVEKRHIMSSMEGSNECAIKQALSAAGYTGVLVGYSFLATDQTGHRPLTAGERRFIKRVDGLPRLLRFFFLRPFTLRLD